MKILCKPLTEDLLDGLASLFATSRECSLCWCMNHRLPPAGEIQGEPAKDKMRELTQEKKLWGILAFDKETCVGWCAIDPILNQPGHDYAFWKHAKKCADTWSVHCLYLHPKYRGQGISTLLVRHAVALAEANGAKSILSFPIPREMRDKFPEHDGEFSGRMSTFAKIGFVPTERINDFYQVMELDPINLKPQAATT
jgi:GNAT superfamily N-acetyltransferase